jgi:hypothetical protein
MEIPVGVNYHGLGKAASKYARYQKGPVLGFRIYIPHVHLDAFSEHLHDYSTLFLDFLEPAHLRIVRRCCSGDHWNGMVDDLKGKALGESLGRCRKPDKCSDFPSADHFFFAVLAAAPPGSVVDRNSWNGYVLVARSATGSQEKPERIFGLRVWCPNGMKCRAVCTHCEHVIASL